MTPELQSILDTYKTKSNKELSTIAVNLFNDFQVLKDSAIILSMNMGDVEQVYKKVYAELQARLKFETPETK